MHVLEKISTFICACIAGVIGIYFLFFNTDPIALEVAIVFIGMAVVLFASFLSSITENRLLKTETALREMSIQFSKSDPIFMKQLASEYNGRLRQTVTDTDLKVWKRELCDYNAKKGFWKD